MSKGRQTGASAAQGVTKTYDLTELECRVSRPKGTRNSTYEIGAIIAVLGIGLFALPAGIIGSGFIEVVQKKRQNQITCPHCGKVIED